MAGSDQSKIDEILSKFDKLEKRLETEDEPISINPITRVRDEYVTAIKLQREFIREGGDFFREMGSGAAADAFSKMATFGQEFFGSAKAAMQPLKELGTHMKSFIGMGSKARTDFGKTAAVMKYLGFETKAVADIMDSAALAYGTNSDQLGLLGRQLTTISRDMMVAPTELAANFREAQKSLAYNAKKMMSVFKGLQYTSRLTGVSFSTLTDVFGEQMDTFEGSSKRAANLNAILGKGVFNSMDLLRKTETERLETIVQGVRSNLRGSVGNLGKFELKGIAEGMGLSIEETRRLLMGKTDVASALADRAKKKALRSGRSPDDAMKALTDSSFVAARSLDDFKRLIMEMRTPVENLKIAVGAQGYQNMLSAIDKLADAFPGLKVQLQGMKTGYEKTDFINKVLLNFGNTIDSLDKGLTSAELNERLGDSLYGEGARTKPMAAALKAITDLAMDKDTGEINMAKMIAILKSGDVINQLAGGGGVGLALRAADAQRRNTIKGEGDDNVVGGFNRAVFVSQMKAVAQRASADTAQLLKDIFGEDNMKKIADVVGKTFAAAMKATGFTGTIDMNSLKNNIKLIAEKTAKDAEAGK